MVQYDNEKEQEPYMATIQASRVSHGGRGACLFASEARHNHYIMVRINTASMRRDLSTDWVHAEEEIIEVAMTEAQWATFISTLNMGSGTPCTLQHIKHEAVEQPRFPENKLDLFHDEMLERLEKARDRLAALKESPAISKKTRLEIEQIEQEVEKNTAFVAERFGAHMEAYISKAKSDIEAYMTSMVMRAGLTALGSTVQDVPLIEEEKGKDQ